MRTTITISDELLDQLKVRAAQDRTTVSALIEEDVRLGELRRGQQVVDRARVPLPTFDLGKSKPGVDLNDNAALLEIMERDA